MKLLRERGRKWLGERKCFQKERRGGEVGVGEALI